MKIIFIIFAAAFLTHCASKEVKENIPEKEVSLPQVTTGPTPIIIDYEGLQKTLELNRSREAMGYIEKPFETCKVGHGYPSHQNCRRDYFVVIHFKLLCRDAHESAYEAFDSSRMIPLSGRFVTWNMRNQRGTITLDEAGFGQILTTAPVSLKTQRLKLTVDNENLHIRASEIGRIVAPPDWCSK